jgi:phosphate transport system substrate-binding protein
MRAQALAIAVLLISSFLLFGCAGNAQAPKTTIKVSGAFALYPLMVKWAEEYQKIHPDVRIDVSAGGAGKGMTDVLSGVVDIGMVSREIDPAEVEKGAYPIKVTTDTVVFLASANSPAASMLGDVGINKEKLASLYMKGNNLSWADIGAGSDAKISLYTRSDSCGAGDSVAKYLGGKQEQLKGVGVYGDPGIVEAVKQDKNGLGYGNLNFAYDMKTGKPQGGLIIVPLDINGNGKVDADEKFYSNKMELIAAIKAKKFPSPPAKDLYVVGKGGFNPKTKEFVNWILNDGQAYVEDTGYVKLTDEVLNAQKAKLGGN